MDFGPGSDTASDVSSRAKGPSFAAPDNLSGCGLSGRINFLSGSPEDVAQTFNCIYTLIQRLQHEKLLKEDAVSEHKRLRLEAQTYEQNLHALRKQIEIKERDIATLKIKGRQDTDRHAEELAVMLRDKDALMKHCNNLTRRQIQFQHEIRRKELQYEWLQEKLRNYLAERKKESSASMEIVGRLKQQSPTTPKSKAKKDEASSKTGLSKKSAARGPKLDETMVKMIVTAYEEKQKELMAENKDLQEALNSIRKEYTDLMNAQIDRSAESTNGSLSRMDSKIFTTRIDSMENQTGEEIRPAAALQGGQSSHKMLPPIPPRSHSQEKDLYDEPKGEEGDAAAAISNPQFSKTGKLNELTQPLVYSEPPPEEPRPPREDPPHDPDHPDMVPWPLYSDVSLKTLAAEGEEALPTVNEEADETMDAAKLEENASLVLTSLSSTEIKEDQIPPIAEDPKLQASLPPKRAAWPPPPPAAMDEQVVEAPKMRPALGRLPKPSTKPVPNAAMLSEEQLKAELRTRAVDVEEAVRALKTACVSMQPQHMRSVMEKRLHMELSMAANLAEQQAAVVNLALAGLEKARRSVPGSDLELEELNSSIKSTVLKSETLVTEAREMLPDDDPVQDRLTEIIQELTELKSKSASRLSAFKESSQSDSRSLEKNISSLRQRANGLSKEKEVLNKARGDLSGPSRRGWTEDSDDKSDEETSLGKILQAD